MDCADCAKTIEQAVTQLDGVQKAQVNFAAGTLQVEYDAEVVPRDSIIQRIHELGYRVEADESFPWKPGYDSLSVSHGVPAQERAPSRKHLADLWKRRRRDFLTVISGLLALTGWALGRSGLPEISSIVAYLLAMVTGGFYTAQAGWVALRTTHRPDMNTLMTIAAIGATLIGEWTEGAVVIFLFALGNALEAYTMDRARSTIRSLMDLSPRTATLIRNDHTETVPVEALRVGDRILVRPGERIPMDGEIIEGRSAVNQAHITGESVPVDVEQGHGVFAGSVNGQGALIIRVTRLSKDNTISRILQMVSEAQGKRAPSQRFVDTFAGYYTPIIVAIAAAVAVLPPLLTGAALSEWFYRALVLLVIACPCALVISTPVAIVSAISTAARRGVLVKGGMYLEALARISAVAFDKTGTLTKGRPVVTDVIPTNNATAEELLAIAAALEQHSEHPLAAAIVEEAVARGLAPEAAQEYQALAGRGGTALIGGEICLVGSHNFFEEKVVHEERLCTLVGQLHEVGKTAVMVSRGEEVIGIIGLADEVRPDSRTTVEALRRLGIRHTIMLTGDNERTAAAIGREAGVEDIRANLLPEDKVMAVEQLLDKYGSVAMVGDGVNDAPALARATVGIAMGAAGTDTALETADVALMADDLCGLPLTIGLSRAVLNVIRQNVAVSLLIKAAFLVAAVLGVATMWMAVFADMGTSLMVTLNGMRLLRYKPPWRSRCGTEAPPK
ncbi:MAG: cadmium-translocating P-type ATPase [Chloroflexi bacterium]|nr:cadmium-translocating P-type ATPase [Chloroflexota bacterium]